MSRYRDLMMMEKTILGTKVTIRVDSGGEFSCHVAGDHYTGKTLSGVMSQVRTALSKRRVKVAVPATILGVKIYSNAGNGFFNRKFKGVTAKNIVLTGLDPRDGDVQWAYEDGSKKDSGDLVSRTDSTICRRMKPEDIRTYERLYKANSDAEDALWAFVKKWELDFHEPKKLVETAIAEKLDTPEEPTEDGDPR